MKTKKQQLTEYGQILQHIETVANYVTDLEKEINRLQLLCRSLSKMLEWETNTDVTAQEWLLTAELWLQRSSEGQKNGL